MTSVTVTVEVVPPRILAAVRREVAPGAVSAAWRPALDKVWAFIRGQSGLWTDGHNLFLYHHPNEPGAPLLCDFGVEVTRSFDSAGEVHATETPGGEAAVAMHRGRYDRVHEAHEAIAQWLVANGRQSAGLSWEIYGRSDARSGQDRDDGRLPAGARELSLAGGVPHAADAVAEHVARVLVTSVGV